MPTPPAATARWNSTRMSVTWPRGDAPSDVAALTNLFRKVSGPSRPGENAAEVTPRPYLTPFQKRIYDRPMRVGLDSPLGKAVVKMAGSKTFMRVGPKVVPHVDRFLHKVSGGRIVMSGGMLPSLVLTTTGAKSGQRRTTPLATKPEGDGWYVVGSNFGRDNHPAWTANLIANPDAEVSFQGKSTPVLAHLLTAEEKTELWPRLVKFWP